MSYATQSTPDFKGDHYSVRMFGAVGDGVTSDTAAFVNAISVALADGSQLYVPPGTYLIDTCSIPANFNLFGAGPKLSILKSESQNDILDITGAAYHHIEIKGLGFVGDGTGTANGIRLHDLSGDPQAINLSNLDFNTLGGSAIRCEDHVLYDSDWSNITARNLGDHGIYIYSMIHTAALHHVYVGEVNTVDKAAYRIINGRVTLDHCNGVNDPTEYWGIFGAEPALDGGLSGTVELILHRCNVEAFGKVGLHFRNGSMASYFGVSIGGWYEDSVALEYRYVTKFTTRDVPLGLFDEQSRIYANPGCTWKDVA